MMDLVCRRTTTSATSNENRNQDKKTNKKKQPKALIYRECNDVRVWEQPLT
jgi:hypothetical protein